ncbi:hypothetical protein AAT19DRAFT_9276 [Rhodotorula toruloides]|uniref:Uncharacterized protein n=1 Tax=Rhodotorula toruloides TaxID=5286 RepID=A0A2T0AJM5_RHOTO|nr:hypothetical protein AAT19DRAFT_9276 [Rhodotorula toruloides]
MLRFPMSPRRLARCQPDVNGCSVTRSSSLLSLSPSHSIPCHPLSSRAARRRRRCVCNCALADWLSSSSPPPPPLWIDLLSPARSLFLSFRSLTRSLPNTGSQARTDSNESRCRPRNSSLALARIQSCRSTCSPFSSLLQTHTTILCGVNCACAPSTTSSSSTTAASCNARESCTYAKEGKCGCGEGGCKASLAKRGCQRGLNGECSSPGQCKAAGFTA